MAKKPTSKTNKAPKKDVTDKDMSAPEQETTTPETSGADDSLITKDDTPPAPAETKTAQTDADTSSEEEAPATEADAADDTDTKDQPADDTAPEAEPEPYKLTKDEAPTPAPTPAPQTESPSAMPMVLGGIAAGAIGFAAAYFGLAQQPDTRGAALTQQMQEVSQSLEDQNAELTDLSGKIDTLSEGPQLGPIQDQLQGMTDAIANLSERVVASETTLEDLEARLTQVEQRPVTESASEAAIAAYERDLEAARAAMAEQRAELESLIENALSTENAAEGAATAAMRRAATSRILTALDSGAPFAAALADLQATGVTAPEALTAVADTGVTSLLDLQESFPDAARAALSASRTVSGEGGGFSGFLRNQLGARSLEPREGNDPDAVLSRAEAALRDGRLTDALAEIEALPEEGRAELSDWAGRAAKRLAAVNAAQSLSETLN